MSQGDTPITVVGNLVEDPNLRYSGNGTAVASFRVASTPRKYDSQAGGFVDGEPLFLTCSVWRTQAENVANSLTKGARVIVTGRLRQRSYEDREGNRRSVFEVDVDDVGPSLRFATAGIESARRGDGNPAHFNNAGGQPGQNQQQGGQPQWNESVAEGNEAPPF
ncbi:single-stranded DNA-binding protein [Corynebacterium macclintockiae]|uniref:single-stranded DNA-binding protein n=1 Tax=Corynebacterium macclintockiae TaxID=2913501 RepID=UPI003EB9B015